MEEFLGELNPQIRGFGVLRGAHGPVARILWENSKQKFLYNPKDMESLRQLLRMYDDAVAEQQKENA